jgi:hypothetical protein
MRSNTFWPIMLILAGVLLLLSNLGLLPGNAWDWIWPVFLILLGVNILFRWRGVASFPALLDSQPLEGAGSARLTLRHGAGRLSVGAGDDPDLLYSGVFGGGVDKQITHSGDRLEATLRPRPHDWMAWRGAWPWNWGLRSGLVWEISLNPAIPLALALESGASENELDFSGLRLTEITLKTGASATRLTLPARAGVTRARIESGVASVDVRVPEGVTARIHGVMGLGALAVDQSRFPKRDGGYESPDFISAPNRVELEVQGGVGSVSVK